MILIRKIGIPEKIGYLNSTKRYDELTHDFQELYQDLHDEGYFQPSMIHTIYRVLEVLTCLGLMFYFAGYAQESMLAKLMTVIFLTLSAGRIGFLTHEVGHQSLTGSKKFDKFLEASLYGKPE